MPATLLCRIRRNDGLIVAGPFPADALSSWAIDFPAPGNWTYYLEVAWNSAVANTTSAPTCQAATLLGLVIKR